MKVQINCGVTKDRKVKGVLIRSKQKVEPQYKYLKDMVVNTLDIDLLNGTHVYRVCRDLKITGDKLKESLLKNRIKIIALDIVKDKIGLVV